MRVLVVEENSTSREIISLYLVKEGIEVVSASNGMEALELFGREGPFDVVVTALDMPYLNGMQLLRTLKKDYGQNIPVIMLSDREDEQERTKAIEEGADSFLVKPLTEIMMTQTIKDILKKPVAGR